MRHGDIKIKFRILDLIKSIDFNKESKISTYEKEVKKYEDYKKKIAPKISSEISRIRDLVDELNFHDLRTNYEGIISFSLSNKCRLKVAPYKPDFVKIDNFLDALKLSSDEFIIIKQSEYDSLM